MYTSLSLETVNTATPLPVCLTLSLASSMSNHHILSPPSPVHGLLSYHITSPLSHLVPGLEYEGPEHLLLEVQQPCQLPLPRLQRRHAQPRHRTRKRLAHTVRHLHQATQQFLLPPFMLTGIRSSIVNPFNRGTSLQPTSTRKRLTRKRPIIGRAPHLKSVPEVGDLVPQHLEPRRATPLHNPSHFLGELDCTKDALS
jgi:hypothetical protein